MSGPWGAGRGSTGIGLSHSPHLEPNKGVQRWPEHPECEAVVCKVVTPDTAPGTCQEDRLELLAGGSFCIFQSRLCDSRENTFIQGTQT